MKEKTEEFLTRLWSVVGSILVIGLAVVGVLGIKACTTNERDRTAACVAAGGEPQYRTCVVSQTVPTANWRK